MNESVLENWVIELFMECDWAIILKKTSILLKTQYIINQK